ncbi:MAG: cache domain-containing protein [Desulfuromonadaceae bacterium]|nr:cache domain-containing protein [Desulfuromonadaceae bacterium]
MKSGIQKKYALSICVFLLIVFSLSCWGIDSYTSALTRDNIQKQQYAMTKIIARSIDDKLGTWLVALADSGYTVPEGVFHNREKAQLLLDQKNGLRSMFSGGIMLLDTKYEIVAETPYIKGRSGKKAVELEAFLKSIEENGLPDISNPYPNPQTNAPSIVMAAPVSDKNDVLLGYLVGSINLTSDYFIEEIMGFKIGKKGYLYLISKDRTLILHPDKNRIMKRDIPLGKNRLLDAALLGFEGSGETINSRGVKQLASFKSLKTVDWILGCVFPLDEAYEPIYRLRSYLLSASAFIMLLSMVLIWVLTTRITFNLKNLTAQVAMIRENHSDSYNNKISVQSTDEVGLLATTFNDLLTKLADKEHDLVSQRDILELQTIELKDALEKVKVLAGIIPICAWCKKIRNDSGYWEQLEQYICDHSDADFTHGVCPECFEKQKKEIEEIDRILS